MDTSTTGPSPRGAATTTGDATTGDATTGDATTGDATTGDATRNTGAAPDMAAVRAALAAECGAGHVRPATGTDVVGTARPALVASPADTEQVAAVLRVAAEHDLAVVPRGAGTKLAWAPPPRRLDLLVDLSRLTAVIEHAVGEFVVRVGAGMPLLALRDALAPTGQRLALDEVVPGATVGGTIATALSGPLRLGYGGVRDLLLGVTVVRADGAITHSGSKVVKNVAGYDLGKLYTGSYGTLGIVTEAILRLHPVPEHAVYVVARLAEDAATAAVAAVLDSQTVPAAIEIHRRIDHQRDGAAGPIDVVVLLEGQRGRDHVLSAPPEAQVPGRLEGLEVGVQARADAVAGLLGAGAVVSATAPPWWGVVPGTATIKVSVPRAAVPAILAAVRETAARAASPVTVAGSAGLGILYVGLSDPAADSAARSGAEGEATAAGEPPHGAFTDRVGAWLEAVRSAATAAGGSAVLLRAPDEAAAGLDVWGPVPAIALMRRVKQEFDPGRLLAPGRFVGGI